MPGSEVRPVRRRASFSIRFAIILGVLGVLIAGATAAIPLDLAAGETRTVALDRAANKAGVAANLVVAQRESLHAFVGGVAGAIAGPLSNGDTAAALQVLSRESLVTGGDDLLGATVDPPSPVLHQGTALAAGDATRITMLSGVARAQQWVLDPQGTPWLLDYVNVPSALPSVTVFVARPMQTSFVARLASDLGSGSDAAQIAVVHDQLVGADTQLAGVGLRRGEQVPSPLQPALGSSVANPMMLTVNGRGVAAAAAPLGGGLALLVTAYVGPSAGFLSSVIGPVAIIAAVMILLSLVVVFSMVQRDLQRPLRRLDRAVAGLAREDFDVPVPAGGDDELGRLATTFEQMRRTLRATLAGAEARAAIAQELNSAQPLQNALQSVCELLRRTTDANAALYAVAHTDMADAFIAGAGLERDVDPKRLLQGGGALAGAMDMDGTVPLQAVALPGSAEAEAGMREVCSAPLRIGSHTFGVVAVADKSLGFNAADVALVSAVAEQTALALERYRILAVVQRQASTDELTSLYNYRFLVDYLDQQIALAERLTSPLAVLMLDLDRFKSLNDTHGHHAGDEALRSFARTLRQSIRRSDLAARYGGEEFVVVMANTNREEARLVAEKIRRAVADVALRFGADAEETRVTVSIGGVAYPDDTGDARQLLRLADDALYRAKRAGRDRVCFVSDGPRRRTTLGPR
ncbi:MAG TPA: diguanylate cyclase [Candidatus Angelobacter sp.]|jgi:diguanylate cyclase (GGDEF)-like protein|nr:diguanylate cyclase [Candidatus Angelobacter sp.]